MVISERMRSTAAAAVVLWRFMALDAPEARYSVVGHTALRTDGQPGRLQGGGGGSGRNVRPN